MEVKIISEVQNGARYRCSVRSIPTYLEIKTWNARLLTYDAPVLIKPKGKGKNQSNAEASATNIDVLVYPFLTGQ